MILSADRKPKKAASIAEVKKGMECRRKTTSADGLTPQNREDLERIVVRLLEIAARCADPAVKHELMKLADDLVKLIEK